MFLHNTELHYLTQCHVTFKHGVILANITTYRFLSVFYRVTHTYLGFVLGLPRYMKLPYSLYFIFDGRLTNDNEDSGLGIKSLF